MLRYGSGMIDTEKPASGSSGTDTGTVEAVLRDELVNGNAMLVTVAPILRHLLANDDSSVFSDDILARVRGITGSLAEQLLGAQMPADAAQEAGVHVALEKPALVAALNDNTAFLGHIHALALEWQLIERLQARLALDPVLAPLVQALIASQEPETARLAMKLLAAQARFAQAMRRMSLPLAELPGDLLHVALVSMRTLAGTEPETDERAARAEAQVRAAYDEAGSRLGLMSRLVSGMGGGAIAALSVTHAGVSLFLSALALASGQDRDMAVFATNEAQLARLALSLRASGLKPANIEEQFLSLHPDIALPDGFERLSVDRAAALLAAGSQFSGA
jgi:hypothetical protein